MLSGLAIILAFYAGGELLRLALHLPIPGNVLGFAALTIALLRGWIPIRRIEAAATLLLDHLMLLFLPVMVGVLGYLSLLRASAPAVVAALILGTAAVLAASGLSIQWLIARRSR